MNTPDQEALDKATVDKVVASLNHSADHLDVATLSRLNQARNNALAADSEAWYSRFLLPAGSIAVAATLVVAMVIQPGDVMRIEPDQLPMPLVQSEVMSIDHMALLAEDIDLLADLDMLEWFGEMAEVYEEAG